MDGREMRPFRRCVFPSQGARDDSRDRHHPPGDARGVHRDMEKTGGPDHRARCPRRVPTGHDGHDRAALSQTVRGAPVRPCPPSERGGGMSAGVKALESPLGRMGVRTVDYVTLLKPELTGLSVLTALFGAFLAQTGGFELRPLLVVLAGTLMVGGGAGTLNQFIERRGDSLMKRTERRPLSSARIPPAEALLFGSALSIAGVLLLAIAGTLFAGMVAFVTSTSYLFLYTPLKKYTPAATFIGGVPRGVPPVIGWTAVRTDLGIEPVLLFLILFAWQMPHFYSLAWMYPKDYQRAGFSILTVSDTTGRNTARRMVLYSALLCAPGPVAVAAGM